MSKTDNYPAPVTVEDTDEGTLDVTEVMLWYMIPHEKRTSFKDEQR